MFERTLYGELYGELRHNSPSSTLFNKQSDEKTGLVYFTTVYDDAALRDDRAVRRICYCASARKFGWFFG